MTRQGSKSRVPSDAVVRMPVVRYTAKSTARETDLVTIEEPLEIRVLAETAGERTRHPIAVTMRTPGQDRELAAGFLVSEGVVRRPGDLWRVVHCREEGEPTHDNVIDVFLAPSVAFDPERLSRHVITSSACGICGRASIEAVQEICRQPPAGTFRLRRQVLQRLPRVLEAAQPVFSRTGGLHAAGLFDVEGRLLSLREDVGRHNALDKLVGALLLGDALPAGERVVMVSGRASFELVQKALLAGIPALAAVGAPSSLAVELARAYGMTLVGFLRRERFNAYSGAERIAAD